MVYQGFFEILMITLISSKKLGGYKIMRHTVLNALETKYRDSPDSTVFVPPGNRTIAKTVLIGDWFSTKIAIYDFWIFKVPFFPWFIYWT